MSSRYEQTATVVVGYDSGDAGHDALELGLALAQLAEGQLVLTSAYHDDIGRTEDRGLDCRRVAAESALASAVKGIPAPWNQRVGTRAIAARRSDRLDYSKGLGRVVIEEGAGMLVLGASHLDGVRRTLFGTGQRLLRDIPCPLAIAPEGFARRPHALLQKIAVAFDDSSASRLALGHALSLAGHAPAEVTLISVAEAGGGLPPSAAIDERARLATAQRRAIAEHLPDVALRALMLRGDPARALTSRSHEFDLLILGSQGNGALGRLVLGSVSNVVMSESIAPVLVVPARLTHRDRQRYCDEEFAISQEEATQ